jgi:hypothetical protein
LRELVEWSDLLELSGLTRRYSGAPADWAATLPAAHAIDKPNGRVVVELKKGTTSGRCWTSPVRSGG